MNYLETYMGWKIYTDVFYAVEIGPRIEIVIKNPGRPEDVYMLKNIISEYYGEEQSIWEAKKYIHANMSNKEDK